VYEKTLDSSIGVLSLAVAETIAPACAGDFHFDIVADIE